MAYTETTSPRRMYLTNLDTGDVWLAQYNPTEWEYVAEASYEEHAVVGMSYEPTQYTGTKNPKAPVTLLLAAENPDEKRELDRMQGWLEAFTLPARGKLRPARALFSWPNEASLTCEVRKATFGRKRFNAEAGTVEMEVKLELVVVHDRRRYADDVARQGLLRPATP